ncbi:MAG: hypothetical protein ACD_28C00429G0002 [uncultured bacterium]|nr:MAG: hypothetical protein ACD_28C00429G0002 [uncultured bacterium]KKT76870.1 MAG: Dihydrouridine synthase DuS [Candidatus Peregrinibacteria bacterium GW2011_GWA2_44_7]
MVSPFRGFWNTLQGPRVGLAPMDGVTEASFRYMMAKTRTEAVPKAQNPCVIFTEFTNVEGLDHGAIKMLPAFLFHELERPIVGQIYGVDPEAFYRATLLLASLDFDGVDLNMGCPAAKVAKQGSGAGLIRTPKLAQELIRVCQKAAHDWSNGITLEEGGVHPDLIEVAHTMRHKPLETLERRLLPISVKTRIGYDTVVARDWVSTLLETAPATITLHGRTLKQMYTGKANWEVIGEMAVLVKASGVGTGLWGNGDIESMAEAEAKINDYGVEGVLVGRGALGNPWFFQEKIPTVKEVLGAAIEHSEYREKELPELPFAPIRKHLLWYCKDFPNAKELRMKLCGAANAGEVRGVIEDFLISKN